MDSNTSSPSSLSSTISTPASSSLLLSSYPYHLQPLLITSTPKNNTNNIDNNNSPSLANTLSDIEGRIKQINDLYSQKTRRLVATVNRLQVCIIFCNLLNNCN